MKRLILKSGVSKKRGSALLITLLLLGVLMTLTLGVSALVIREIRVTQSVVDANKAFYASEAGVERALLGLKQGLPGAEPQGAFPREGTLPTALFSDDTVDSESVLEVDPAYKYFFSTSNKTDSVPGFPDDQPIFVEQTVNTASSTSNDIVDCRIAGANSPFALAVNKDQLYAECPRATYRKLALNETHIIPLYSDDGSEEAVNVNDFLVEYYLSVRDGSGFSGVLQNLKLESLDVLRWKLYGKPFGASGVQRTESIADFYPGVTNNGPQTPVCIGTDPTIQASNESCLIPSLSKRPPTTADLENPELNLEDLTLWSAARECYATDAGTGVTGGALIKGTTIGDFTGCSMRDFIDNHQENYLVLTNMMNPSVVGVSNLNDPAQLARANIYYRVLARRPAAGQEAESVPQLVKDYAEIRGVGYAMNDQVVKSLDVRYKAPGFLPVFNFSLYKTSEAAPENADD